MGGFKEEIDWELVETLYHGVVIPREFTRHTPRSRVLYGMAIRTVWGGAMKSPSHTLVFPPLPYFTNLFW